VHRRPGRGRHNPVVLADVDRSLDALLAQRLGPEKVSVAFGAPTPEWAARQKGTVIDLFLHDVREDLTARTGDWDDVRDGDGRVIGRQPPPRRYLLSYLVSAWAADPLDEHRVLGLVLETALEQESIPPELLQGRLADQELPVLLQVAVTDVPGPEPFDLWSSIGTPLRTSLRLLVVAPMVPDLSTELAPPAERIDLGMSKQEGSAAAARGAMRGADGAAQPVPVGRVVKRWSGIRLTEKVGDEAEQR
jgi:hypothetical protein